jgi:hydroxypyruvate isomerase
MIESSRLVLSTSILLQDLHWASRPAAAVELGYTTVESWWPWMDGVASIHDIARLRDALESSGATLYLMNLTEGSPRFGHRGLAGVPDADESFWANVDSLLKVAAATGLRYVNALAGSVSAAGPAAGLETLIARLAEFADRAASLGIGVLVEQLNSVDHPDYLLTDPDTAVNVVERIRAAAQHSNVGLLADVYHLGRAGIDPVGFVRSHASIIDHVQLADSPGRGAPGTGVLPIFETLTALSEEGYAGRVGLEFKPGPGYLLPSPGDFMELMRINSLGLQQEGA